MLEYSDSDSSELTRWKLNREQAFSVHSNYQEDGRNVFNSAMGMALEAIRTATLINGGAVIAVFAFLGSLFGSDNLSLSSMRMALIQPAFLFATGAILSGVASGASYFSQILFARAHIENEMTWVHPYITVTPAAQNSQRWGEFWRGVAVALVGFSYLALTTGLIKAYHAVTG